MFNFKFNFYKNDFHFFMGNLWYKYSIVLSATVTHRNVFNYREVKTRFRVCHFNFHSQPQDLHYKFDCASFRLLLIFI